MENNFKMGDIVYHGSNPKILFVVTEPRTDNYINCEAINDKGEVMTRIFKKYALRLAASEEKLQL